MKPAYNITEIDLTPLPVSCNFRSIQVLEVKVPIFGTVKVFP